MAATSQSQQRCVFVGNIPYDATEEQLIQILEEVGPVVSFRLVVDRETGKPKGYGFCEYKDEETALSARRNLQGYDINGRQLRVDFAETGKNVDKNREPGRGGPRITSNPDPQKQSGGVAMPGHSGLHQPMGDSVAMAASTVMAGALGATQIGSSLNPTGLQGQILNDPLTNHLAKMSRSQLIEVVSELKAMALQNKEQVRQLLLAIPNLPKALLQALIMLGMVTPQMLQTANIHPAHARSDQPLQTAQTVSRLPPLSLDKTKVGYQPYGHESQVPTSSLSNQHTAPFHQMPARPQLIQNEAVRQTQLLQQSKASSSSSLPHTQPQSVGVRPYVEASTSSSFRQHEQLHPSLQRIGQPQLAKVRMPTHSAGASSKGAVNMATPMSISLPASNISIRQGEAPGGKAQVAQLQLPSGVDSTLLQQLLNLTPEQLSSLPIEQQQQVIQLQQMLSRAA